MNCKRCGKKLTPKQVKSGNLFCGYECSNRQMADNRRLPESKRFFEHVDKTDDCWIWTSAIDKDGYGVFADGNRKYNKAHRFSYKLAYGVIPKGKIICHHCDNPSCVNPEHLYAGTYKDNTRDMFKRGRNPKQDGENNHNSVLSWNKVRKIRKMWASGNYTQAEIANEFNVSRGCVLGVIYNINWKE